MLRPASRSLRRWILAIARRDVLGHLCGCQAFNGRIEIQIRREFGASLWNDFRAFSNDHQGIIMTDSIPRPTVTLLRMTQVKARTGLSRSTIYLRIKAGEFPTQVSLGPRAVGWLEAEIERWIETRIERSRPHRGR
jgi:prophage regulatory protein